MMSVEVTTDINETVKFGFREVPHGPDVAVAVSLASPTLLVEKANLLVHVV